MKSIWIIGGGRFGVKAGKMLKRKNPDIDITIVEKNNNICNQTKKLSLKTVCMDGIAYLAKHLKGPDFPDWIVPAIPVHVAYEWIRIKLSEKYRLETIEVPDKLITTLPNPLKGKKSELYISNADFICPENCPEPDEMCTYTGEPRPRILHRFLESLHYNDFHSVVIHSRQLSVGIGGYKPRALFDALTEVTNYRTPILLSTACRCHGVMHAFKISPVLKPV